MTKNEKKKVIKCDVENCAFNDNELEECELNQIKITSTDEEEYENETICNSYEDVNDSKDEEKE